MRTDDARKISRILAGAWLSVPIALLLAGDVLAQCRVEGTVRASDGTPIRGVSVRVRGPEQPPLTATTDDDGHYVFENVKAGIRVEIVALENGRTVARSLALVTLWVETVDLRQVLQPLTGGPGDLDPQGGPSAEIRGVVRSTDGASVAGARVTINQTTVATITDSAGRYAFGRLRSGLALELNVSANGFKPAAAEVSVPGSQHADADFVLETVRPPSTADRTIVDSEGDGSSLTVRPEDVSGVPSFAPTDIFRALQFLPDAVGSLEAPSELYVRGGTPGQTLIRYDGFTMYPFSNTFGGLTAVNMEAIENAGFSGSAVDAADGGHLAGVLNLTGATNRTARPSASIAVSMLGVATRLSAPLGDRAAFVLAARRSPPTTLYNELLDRVDSSSGRPMRNRVARFSGGVFAALPESSFSDVNGKVEIKVAPTDRVSFTFYDAREAANKSRDVALPATTDLAAPGAFALPADAVAQIGDVERWTGRGMSAAWERQWSRAVTSALSIGRSEFSKTGDASSLLTSASSGQDYSLANGRGGSDGLAESNRIEDTTVRLVSSIRLGFEHLISAGGEVASLDSDYNAQTEVFQRTGLAGTYTSKLVDLFSRSSSGRTTSLFIQDAWRPFGSLTVSPGARLAHYDLAGSTSVEPRVNASYRIGHRLRVTGAWSIDHQSANRIVREDLVRGDGAFWALADGSTIPVARARQVDIGAGIVTPSVIWDTRAYYKALDDLTLFAPRLFPGVTLNENGSLLHRGSGRAMGLETLLRYQAGWNTGSISYTLGRAEYTYPTLEAAAFPASFDQTHELKVADVARLRGWLIGAAWVLGSGRPDTPSKGTTQVWFPSGDAVYDVTFGPKNSARLPPYHRLDLSTQREIRLGALTVGLGATLLNVYDRQNVAYHEYDVAGNAAAVSDVLLMRRTLNLSLALGF